MAIGSSESVDAAKAPDEQSREVAPTEERPPTATVGDYRSACRRYARLAGRRLAS